VLITPRVAAAVPALGAAEAVLEDLSTGQVLLAKDPAHRRPIASLVKIMTAETVLASAKPSDVVTVKATATGPAGAKLKLRPGERISVGELTYGLMLQSSNDAALALAEHVGGTVAAFVSMMNRRAAALGLRNTSFVSPNGLDDRGLSTALDMATITRVAYRSEEFRAIVATKFRDIPAPSGPVRHIQNRNALLWLYSGSIGVKTGFTSAAGHCLVAAARRGNRALVSVVLGDPTEQSSFDDAAALLNYGFAGFARRVVVRGGSDLGAVRVGDTAIRVAAASDVAALVPVHAPAAIRWAIRALPGLTLPVDAGQRVGRIIIIVNGRAAGAVDAVAISPVPSPPGPLQPARPAPGPAESMVALLKGLIEALVDPFL